MIHLAAQFITFRAGSRITDAAFSPSHYPADARISGPLCDGRKEAGKTGKNGVKEERINKYLRNTNHDLHCNYFRDIIPSISFPKIYNLWIKN